MTDMNLNVDVSATTAKLEKGLKRSEQLADKAGKKMASSLEKTGDAGEKAGGQLGEAFGDELLAKIGKVAAGLFLLEGAFKLATAAASDSDEQVRAMLTSLPVLGPLVTAVLDFTDALEKNSESAKHARASLLELDLAQKQLAATIATTTAKLSAESEMLATSGLEQHEITLRQHAERVALVRDELEAKIDAINAEYNERAQAVLDANLGYEEEERILIRIRDEKYAAREAAREEAAMKEATLSMQKQQAQAEKEQRLEEEKALERAERKNQLDAEAEAHHRAMQEIEAKRKKEEKERIEAEKKAAKERDEQRKKEEAFLESKKRLEDEMAEARASAAAAVAGATASFATAGGSFTTGVSAQVNEQKVANKISEQSRDFLSEIVRNTAMMAGGLSLA